VSHGLQTFSLPREVIDALTAKAQRQGISIDAVVARLIANGLPRYEESFPWRLTEIEEAWQEAQR